MNAVAALRQRVEIWFVSRRPACDQIVLTQHNVYIVPTRAGWMLGATLLVLLVASINYQLNLGYLLTFLLAGSAAMGMHVCHATLRGLAMHLITPEAHYAGAAATLRVVLHNERSSVRYGIALAVRGTGRWSWTDVPAQGAATVEVAFQPQRRGLHPAPVLTAETRFPLGTFSVWTVWRPAARMLVYPAPEQHAPPLPPGELREGEAMWTAPLQGAGEYDSVRAYRRGDPLKLIVWKKAARAQGAGSNELVSRDAEQAQRTQLWLDAQATGLADLEACISRLSAWVLQADRLGLDYGLRIGTRIVAPARGEAHKRACLEMLATC